MVAVRAGPLFGLRRAAHSKVRSMTIARFARVTTLLGVAAFVSVASGCKGKGDAESTGPAPAATSATAAPAVSTSPPPAAAPAASASAAPKTKGSCPTSVTGVTSTVADTPDGVALTIVAKDAPSGADVRDRAHALVQLIQSGAAGGGGGGGRGGGGGGGAGGGDGTGPGPGDGTGAGAAGGGGLGRCPVVVRGVSLDVQDTKDGAVVTMRPKSAKDLDFIRKQVRSRLAGD
jgi:hypothetical protein